MDLSRRSAMPPDGGVTNMRYVCVLLVLLGMPLPASAQREHRADRPPTGPGAIGLGLSPIGLPTPIPYQKPWEWRVPVPSWERPQVPAWERQGPPSWERGHVARPVYPQPTQRRDRQRTPPVVYVMQPYPVAQPYPVYVTVPAPAAPQPPPAPPEPEVEPEPPPPPPPIVLPTGSRTLYVIRGCYLGNVKPDADRLPKGCDISRMKIYEP